ncbi:alpha-mannosidase [Goodfellowiella coeruleoviolacea]|uniref:alpha-mannosidase n=1 Tax=Goodfellowiella coeruleoviolacea TaxID=334858 RepID=A0AAE3KLE0_9PSEU|nr:glycoside hydrolase family 38 C-terminal domain-containing protein [Goodfellowiella coeruleoviolacea]MCP2166433.1 alpha-mannosidase [Goodfellowiella coeruleoviolacea]
MHDDRTLVEQRLDRVLRERIRPAVYAESVPLEVAVWHAPGEPVPVADGLAADYRPARVGDAWGPAWGTSWFRVTGTVPPEWAGRTVEAVLDLGFTQDLSGFSAEGLVYRPDGTAVKGLNPRNTWVRIAAPARGGERVLLHVEAAANPLILPPTTALGDPLTAGDAPLYRLARMDLAVFDEPVWELVQDLDVLGQLMHELSVDSPRRWEILRAIERCLDTLDLDDIGGSAPAARAVLAPALAAPAHASAHQLSAVGHAHIDSAWLWPLRETVRKVARTAANVVALMDEHPEFVFAMSQAQQLAWLKEHRPEVYARVREKVAAGQFVPVGGMWVESDTNMPGAEALARQFVHGKRFFLDEFGLETREVWLPDSFGYSAALPQLVALSGSTWFLTQKISWSQFNKFPHHTFAWEGLDGTRVFTHFPPVDTYNAEFTGRELAHAVRNFQDKGVARHSLVPFGFGDGGGGPTREMLARAARLADLEGSPRVRVEKPAEFFARAQADYPNPPVWVGELYLELHRGTYTSQAKTKQGNRRSEHLLREAELWAATAALRTGFAYPYQELDRIWKTVLLHQFHDILPGSSIAWVHRQARQTYAELAEELRALIASAQRALAGEPGAGTLVFNAAPHTRSGVPAGGAGFVAGPAGDPVAVREQDGGFVLDNGLLRVVVDARGLVTSVYDIAAEREAVAPGAAANLLQLHPDLPNNWDAWDVDPFYRNTVRDLTELDELSLVVKDDPELVALRVVRSFGASTARQVLTLRAGAKRLDVDTEVDWYEREKFLKVAFPLDVRAESATAQIQFGHVSRPTHTNTSWEAAKFEVCAHRFLHVGEPGWGAALVNDSTYGHDVSRTVRPDGGTTTTVRLSLLRAPRYPDPETDQGTHRLRYALVPGADIADAVREGYFINLPERTAPGGAPVEPLVRISDDAVVVESVKLADDRSGDVVVRLYEAGGGRARARLSTGFPLAAATETDLLERPLPAAPPHAVSDNGVTLTLRPFQIRTLRLRPARTG